MNNYLKEIKAIGIFALIGIIVFGFAFILRYFKIETYFYQPLDIMLMLPPPLDTDPSIELVSQSN